MTKKIVIDPITRIEGHLKIEVEVENGKVRDAKTFGEMFRGWEIILKGRDPKDAQMISQRICGVCPSPHAQASTLCLDDAFGVHPPDNGRLIRNLILGSNFIQSHILHFYHLAALDFVDITAILKYTGNDPALNKLKAWAKGIISKMLRPTSEP
jgi:Ni,Fe-hydrogenase I large subunit